MVVPPNGLTTDFDSTITYRYESKKCRIFQSNCLREMVKTQCESYVVFRLQVSHADGDEFHLVSVWGTNNAAYEFVFLSESCVTSVVTEFWRELIFLSIFHFVWRPFVHTYDTGGDNSTLRSERSHGVSVVKLWPTAPAFCLPILRFLCDQSYWLSRWQKLLQKVEDLAWKNI